MSSQPSRSARAVASGAAQVAGHQGRAAHPDPPDPAFTQGAARPVADLDLEAGERPARPRPARGRPAARSAVSEAPPAPPRARARRRSKRSAAERAAERRRRSPPARPRRGRRPASAPRAGSPSGRSGRRTPAGCGRRPTRRRRARPARRRGRRRRAPRRGSWRRTGRRRSSGAGETVAREREIARSQSAGRATKTSGPMQRQVGAAARAPGRRSRSGPCRGRAAARRRRSWRWSSRGSGQKPLRIAVWARSARWESATGLGSTVVPEENWTRARSSGSSGRRGGAPPWRAWPGRSPRARQPSAGRACATAWPRRRRTRRSASTSRAPGGPDHAGGAPWYSAEAPEAYRRVEGHRHGAGRERAEEGVEELDRRWGRPGPRGPPARRPAAARAAPVRVGPRATSAQGTKRSRSRRSTKRRPRQSPRARRSDRGGRAGVVRCQSAVIAVAPRRADPRRASAPPRPPGRPRSRSLPRPLGPCRCGSGSRPRPPG